MTAKPKIEADLATKNKAAPRRPSRARGVIRYELFLDSVEALLDTSTVEDIGIYQIAEHAGVPTASVYHFFPTKEAAILGLAQRYMNALDGLGKGPVDYEALRGWRQLLTWDVQRAVDYFHAHPSAMRILLGLSGGIEALMANNEHTKRTGMAIWQRHRLAFHMPALPDADDKYHIALKLIDSVLGISFLEHGRITPEHFEAAINASTAYCRLYLPEYVELRDEHRIAMAEGRPITLVPAAPNANGRTRQGGKPRRQKA